VSRPETTDAPIDVLHVCFGGLGGHAGVVGPLDAMLHRRGIKTAVVRYGPAEQLADDTGWSAVCGARVVEKRGRLDVPGLAELTRLVRDLAPRVVLCHTASAAGPAFVGQLLAGRRPRVGLVEHQAVDLRSRSDQLSSALALAFVRAVAVLSTDYARRYPLSWVPLRKVRQLVVLPSGIDLVAFSPAPTGQAPGDDGRGRVIGMTCRLVATKDVATLLRSLSLLRALIGDRLALRLRIAGDGPDRPDLERLIGELSLTEVVELTGTLDEKGVIALLRGLDVYVQSTLGESGATAVLQAYAVGLPVVASDVEGVRDVVRDGVDGILVPGRDPAALAECLAALLLDAERLSELGAAARRRAEQDFGAEPMAERYLGFLDRIDPGGPWERALVAG
jgi:glycosyltransferase involved in cell wall biosynthesis